MLAFQVDGPWQDVCNKYKQADGAFKQTFDKAKEVRETLSKRDFFPSEVSEEHALSVRCIGTYTGYTAEQFADAFGHTPTELGFKLRDLKDERNKGYKGVLVRDPSQPLPKYEVSLNISQAKKQYALQLQNNLHEEQADNMQDYRVKQAKKRKAASSSLCGGTT